MASILPEYGSFDATGLADLVRRRELSATELLDVALSRCLEMNPRVNAVSRVMEVEARRAIEAGLPQGPFCGVPFLLKDLNLLYAGVPTSNGGGPFCSLPAPDQDWDLTRRYRAAGLVIFGKTSTPELGINASTEPRAFGPTRNPHDPDYSAGGSSGGAAAAVAAGIVPAAHASDGGGSIRIPAAFCGLVGLKPSRGRISFGPDLGEGWAGLGTPHVITRTVRDTAALLDVAAGPGIGDPYGLPAPSTPFAVQAIRPTPSLRIAFYTTPLRGGTTDTEVRQAVEHTAALCESLGHVVVEAAPKLGAARLERAVETIIAVNLRAFLEGREAAIGRPVEPNDVEPITWCWAERGRQSGGADYVRACQTVHAVGREIAAFMDEGRYDLVLTPTVPHPPFRIGARSTLHEDLDLYLDELFASISFTAQYNASGQPAISLPMHRTSTGLPIGIQFAARQGGEGLLLQVATQLESTKTWAAHRAATRTLTV